MSNMQSTSEILGYGKEIQSYQQLDEKVRNRLPVSKVDAVLNDVFLGNEHLINKYKDGILPKGSRTQPKLTEAQSDTIARLARVYARTVEIFNNDKDHAREFLLKPHKALYNKRPIDMARTELGAIQVEDLLGRIYYGIVF